MRASPVLSRRMLFATLLLSLATPLAGHRAIEVTDADFLAWAVERSIALESLDPGEVGPESLAFLDEALEGVRVVYLGETDHFVAERMEFRLLLIRELAKRGFRRIGMEMGRSDALRMDRYLETGDERWLDRVALYGYRGDLREDRVDEVPGWTDDSSPELTATVTAEAWWFLRRLRAMNEALPEGEPRLSWFGYDLSFRPGGGYADAREVLAPHAEDALVARVLERMERVPGESRGEEAARLEALVALLDEHREALRVSLGDAGVHDVRGALQRMADAFRFVDGLQQRQPSDLEKTLAALSAREQRMFANFDEYLAEWPADEKVVLLGHALHLSRSSESIETAGFGPMWKSIGTYLAERLPGEVYGIWLLHERGDHGAPGREPSVQRFRSPAGSIERLLARVHPLLLLPLHSGDPREAWLEEERVFSQGGSPIRALLARQVDCLFFVREAHAPGVRWRDESR